MRNIIALGIFLFCVPQLRAQDVENQIQVTLPASYMFFAASNPQVMTDRFGLAGDMMFSHVAAGPQLVTLQQLPMPMILRNIPPPPVQPRRLRPFVNRS